MRIRQTGWGNQGGDKGDTARMQNTVGNTESSVDNNEARSRCAQQLLLIKSNFFFNGYCLRPEPALDLSLEERPLTETVDNRHPT